MIIRDPLWNNIRVDALALQLVDTPVFQRLRYVRQLGLAYLVYPGATHTRFEHALGAYHLARITIALLEERGELGGVPLEERAITQAAALLHDVGHYPFSHALEEIGELHHEEVAAPLVLVDEPAASRRVIGVLEKGLSALESLLFAKYQMYRNVYWHHAVRSATAMYKRLVDEALAAGDVDARALSTFDDEGLLHRLARRGQGPLLSALRERRLYKRVLECPAAELSGEALEWIADDRALTTETENRLATELGLSPGELLLDFPAKTQMLGLDLPVVRRSGEVRRLTTAGLEGAINLPVLSEQLYQSARWLRVFAVRRIDIPRGELIERLVAIGNRESGIGNRNPSGRRA